MQNQFVAVVVVFRETSRGEEAKTEERMELLELELELVWSSHRTRLEDNNRMLL